MEEQEAQGRFLFLVEEYRMAAWIGLGKLKDPASGDIRRNLDLARHAIDTLGMLEQKTRGNLAREEERFLRQALTDLRLNFVEELSRPEPPAGAPPADEKSPPAGPGESATGEEASAPATGA